jgi:hypothetical protein
MFANALLSISFEPLRVSTTAPGAVVLAIAFRSASAHSADVSCSL